MILKKGSRGDEVRALQKALHLYEDGIFGVLTEEAVKEYQKTHGLVADGIVGDKTWAKLFPSGNPADTLKKSKRVINEIIVHCTATPEGEDMTVEQITASHKKRGFTTIGYHYVVYRDGSIHKGRNVDVSGAHCTGHNTHSIGVCYVGGLENIPGVAYDKLPIKDTRTAKQKTALLKLLKDLKALYPKAKIIGHRDTSPDRNGNGIIEPFEWIKGCPCFDAKTEYKNI